MSEMNTARLHALLSPDAPPFALLHRPHSAGHDDVELLLGDVTVVPGLGDLPLPSGPPSQSADGRHDLVVLVPYRQIAERGYAHQDDGTPLLAMTVDEQTRLSVAETLATVPDRPFELADAGFDTDDAEYETIVRKIMSEEIGRGEGANFVIKRSFVATVQGPPTEAALTVFRRLLAGEAGAYWTFLVHTGTRTLVGATPERHVALNDGTVTMTPISGTYRYPASGPTVPGTLRFLADPKETDELYMVVDEELKMMARICEPGVRTEGPYLRQMTRLAHTEYHLSGRTTLEVGEILRETMFVPTVTGSPLENACRVINRYETEGRAYYSGVLAVIGRDGAGTRRMDSAVLIRCADIDARSRLRIGVGATLVRHSDPGSEVAETRAKAAAVLQALHGGVEQGAAEGPALAADPAVLSALADRNRTLARFWLDPFDEEAHRGHREVLAGRRVLLIDGEDTFTAMLAHQLLALGLRVIVRRFDESYEPAGHDLVIVGPGPGDPRERNHPKIAALRRTVRELLAERRPLLAVCLGHQVLCAELGLELIRKNPPNQGVRRVIDLFGSPAGLGFYNTYAALSPADRLSAPQVPEGIDVSRDPDSGEVHALRGERLRSTQFHPESLLSEDGLRILADDLSALLSAPVRATG
ncbi:anthranilate synthase family protein [Streptomyces sp. NBC_01619]|uniref:anthranilate synthase family protein n=1 Tax=Streptomyces sp. NBC_01619 TaxID=2975901 RepID=UPI00225641BC|nr:anthranilate synthase family protein [Streptomyces sp. NBC_01619]MCX4515068.1 anthranilate synthase family protein [Streptomyces sp. NBC_01619]